LWEETAKPDTAGQQGLWSSTVRLSEPFFKEITNRPVPFDMRIVQLIREKTQSPLALDLYLWLNYRLKYLSRPTDIPWRKPQLQFGANYADTRQGRHEFKREFLKQLEIVRLAFRKAAPSIQDSADGKGIRLLPGTSKNKNICSSQLSTAEKPCSHSERPNGRTRLRHPKWRENPSTPPYDRSTPIGVNLNPIPGRGATPLRTSPKAWLSKTGSFGTVVFFENCSSIGINRTDFGAVALLTIETRVTSSKSS
jgi:Plasmid encoded RepA protein